MASSEKAPAITPRIIIHGGAGNITRSNLSPESRRQHKQSMLDILTHTRSLLRLPGVNALDVATFAVSLLENNPLFNSGKGAVYTTAGTIELEASVMVSRGYRKRGCGVMGMSRVKNPVKLAREMLVRGDWEGGGGAQGHQQLHGESCDKLAREWGLETVEPSYFWTRRVWDAHRKALGEPHDDETYKRHKREADEGAKCGATCDEVGSNFDAQRPPPPYDPDGKDKWSPAIRQYVRRAFEPENAIPGIDAKMIAAKLKEIITTLAESRLLETIDWSTYPLPQHFIRQDRDEAALYGAQDITSANCKASAPMTNDDFSNGKIAVQDAHSTSSPDDTTWDRQEYIPQGTVGAVVMDSTGTICAATSTGGLANKLPGRIGDTPTLGAGFWAEEWTEEASTTTPGQPQTQSPLTELAAMISDCIPSLTDYLPLPSQPSTTPLKPALNQRTRAVAMSGTGNGDSFLRLNAVRTAAAIARYQPSTSLQSAVTTVAGPGGMLQQSAEDRWGREGGFEGRGGMIGIEFTSDGEGGGKGEVVFDFNCGGMFHAWVDDEGRERYGVFQDDK